MVEGWETQLGMGRCFRRPPERGFETGDVPSRRRPNVVAPARLVEWGDVPSADPPSQHGAPAELNRAMFPIRRDRSELRSSAGCSLPTTRPRVSHRLPTAAVLDWGSRPWTARGKRSLPSPAPGRSRQPGALRFCRVSITAPPRARFPRFVHGAGPRQNPRRVGEGWETQLQHQLNRAMFLSTTRRTFARIETGDVSSRWPGVIATTDAARPKRTKSGQGLEARFVVAAGANVELRVDCPRGID